MAIIFFLDWWYHLSGLEGEKECCFAYFSKNALLTAISAEVLIRKEDGKEKRREKREEQREGGKENEEKKKGDKRNLGGGGVGGGRGVRKAFLSN